MDAVENLHEKAFRSYAPGHWPEIPPEQWNDWKWQLRNRVTTLESLEKKLRLTPEEWQELQDRFQLLLDEYANREGTEGRPYSIFLAMYEDRSRD